MTYLKNSGFLLTIVFTLAIISGQLIKLSPAGTSSGATLLDILVSLACIWGLFKVKFKKPPIYFIAALIFILIAILSLVLTPLSLNFSEYLTSFFYTARFAVYILLGYLIYLGCFPEFSKKITQILTFSGIGLAIIGLAQLLIFPDLSFLQDGGWDTHYFRTVSTFLDPNFLGGYLTLTLLLLVSEWEKIIEKKEFILKAFFILVCYLALVTTFSRGSYLMFAISFTLLALLKKSVKIGLFTVICLVGIYIGYSWYIQAIANPRNINKSQSAQTRVDSWEIGGKMFSQYPILGVGHNSYRYALEEFNLASSSVIESRGASANSSSLLQVTSTTGILGFLSFIFYLGSLLFISWKSYLAKNPLGVVFLVGLLGLIAHSFFTNSLFYPFLLIWLILITPKVENI